MKEKAKPYILPRTLNLPTRSFLQVDFVCLHYDPRLASKKWVSDKKRETCCSIAGCEQRGICFRLNSLKHVDLDASTLLWTRPGALDGRETQERIARAKAEKLEKFKREKRRARSRAFITSLLG